MSCKRGYARWLSCAVDRKLIWLHLERTGALLTVALDLGKTWRRSSPSPSPENTRPEPRHCGRTGAACVTTFPVYTDHPGAEDGGTAPLLHMDQSFNFSSEMPSVIG